MGARERNAILSRPISSLHVTTHRIQPPPTYRFSDSPSGIAKPWLIAAWRHCPVFQLFRIRKPEASCVSKDSHGLTTSTLDRGHSHFPVPRTDILDPLHTSHETVVC